jgi:UDP-N-acetylmuramoyl-tripeptide--D-alanyl-D-alanine ligase
MELTLAQVVAATGARVLGAGGAVFTAVSTDTRTLAPGALFVALRGEHHDAHDYLDQAWAAGAAAVLVDRAVEPPAGRAALVVADTLVAYQQLAAAWRARFSPLVVGITGSVGKTGCKELTAAVLGQRWTTLRSARNFNNEVGLPATLLRLGPEHGAAVLEMGMRGPGQIAELARLAQPDIGVLTTIGHSHLGVLGSRQAIAAAKGELLVELSPCGTAVLNADDEHQAALAGLCRGRVVWYGLGAGDVRAGEVRSAGLHGTRFLLTLPGDSAAVDLPVAGRHMVANALAAAAVGWVAGLDAATIAAGLTQTAAVPGRLELVRLASGARVINDAYNAAPESVRAALAVLADEPTAGRRIAVLGDMLELGEMAEAEHLRLGQDAAGLVDVLVGVGELGALVVEGAQTQRRDLPSFRVSDAQAAGELLASLVAPGDLVLLKASRALALEQALARLEVAS